VNKWKTEYYYSSDEKHSSNIEDFFDHLTNEQLKSLAKELRLLELCGNTLRLPHSKSLGQGLFELRERKFGYRIYYTFCKNQIIVLLHAGDKSSQKRDIKKAQELLTKFLSESIT
jgi:putative addiction module killer protein